jgi:hypothetical protein
MSEISLTLFEEEALRLEADKSGVSLSELLASIFCPEGDMHREAESDSDSSSTPEGDMHLVALTTH